MKRIYQKPQCLALSLNVEGTVLSSSIEGGSIGGVTDRFDIRRRQFLFDDEEEDEW